MTDAGSNFPPSLYYLVEHQVWLRAEPDGLATVGITSLGIELAGEIYMCRPKAVGSLVVQGGGIGVVELAKSIVSVKSPASGEVVAVNPALASAPELVHCDPYGAGWLVRLRLTGFDADRSALVTGDAVAAAMQHHAWLMNAARPGAGR